MDTYIGVNSFVSAGTIEIDKFVTTFMNNQRTNYRQKIIIKLLYVCNNLFWQFFY